MDNAIETVIINHKRLIVMNEMSNVAPATARMLASEFALLPAVHRNHATIKPLAHCTIFIGTAPSVLPLPTPLGVGHRSFGCLMPRLMLNNSSLNKPGTAVFTALKMRTMRITIAFT